MFEPEKLIQIVSAWLEYIRQEEMTNAEVEKGWGSYQKVFDEGVGIVGNKLLLDNSCFTQFKQQFLALKRRGHEKEFQIAVAGPQIYKVQGKGKEQRLKYLPLFTIDISSIFQGNYHKSGWDLTGFEFHPVIMNLMRLYRLEEEEAESLIVTGGLLRFLEDTFKKKFSTLQAFLNRIDLPEKYKVNRNAYLVRYNFVPFTAQLKQDLRDILQQLLQDPERCSWLSENHPAWQYLNGSPAPPRHEVMFWGAFFTHAPDEFQAQGIKHAQNNCLTALWGGPGTGKTETELHLVAQQIVQRVKQLLETGKDENYLMVMSSTNNSAIRKFQNRLVLEGQTAPLSLNGGNQGIIKHSTLPLLLEKIEHLRSTQFDPHAHEQAKRAFLETLSQLQRFQEQEPVDRYQRAAAVRLGEQLDVDLQDVREELAATEQALLSRQQQLAELSDYSQFPLEDYRQIQAVLSETWQSLPRDDNSLLKQTLDWIGGITAERIFERLGRKINIFVLRTLSTPFPFKPPSNREQLIEARQQVSQQITTVETWHNLKLELDSQQQRREQLEQKLADLTTQREEVSAKLKGYPESDFYSRFYRDYHELQIRLFHHAWEFLQLETLRRSNEVIPSLSTYGSALSGDGDALLKLEIDGQSIYRDLSLVFPVITTSLHSLRNMLPHLQPSIIKLSLLDEGGTTLVHQPFPLLVRSQQVVIAGDPQQIEPIVNLCNDTIKQYRLNAFIEPGLTDDDYYRYAPTAKYTATAYHRAAGASGREGDLGTGIILSNHYRSTPPIISFCSPNYLNGLNILVDKKPSKLGPNLLAYHVEGSHVTQTNPQEIDGIITAISLLLSKGYQIAELGIMSPYLSQAGALKERLRATWRDFKRDDIGTVHNFQGGQKKAIVFSPYQCSDQHSFWYINRRPNLLNTAVSRAEELFIVIGNLKELENAGSETKRLIEHIRTRGEISTLPSETSSDCTKQISKKPFKKRQL